MIFKKLQEKRREYIEKREKKMDEIFTSLILSQFHRPEIVYLNRRIDKLSNDLYSLKCMNKNTENDRKENES